MRTWSWHWSWNKPVLIVCSACVTFIAYRWRSLLIRFNTEVVVGSQSHFSNTWLDMHRVHCPKGQSRWYLHVLFASRCSEMCWAQSRNRRKMIVICPEGRKGVCWDVFTRPDLVPLFRKQEQAVRLTARDNVKGMKTYTITSAFLLSAHSVALWVTVVLSNKLQATKPTPADRKCVYAGQTPYPQWCKHRSDLRFE